MGWGRSVSQFVLHCVKWGHQAPLTGSVAGIPAQPHSSIPPAMSEHPTCSYISILHVHGMHQEIRQHLSVQRMHL
jgi:hypothetical protein